MLAAVESLKKYDVILAAFGIRSTIREAAIVSHPKLNRSTISFYVHPVRKTWREQDCKLITYRAGQAIEVLGSNRAIRPKEAKQFDYLLDSIFLPCHPSISLERVQQLMQLDSRSPEQLAANTILKIVRRMTKSGLLTTHAYGNQLRYRVRLPRVDGLAVRIYAGQRGERVGWIEEWREMGDFYRPIARTLSGQQIPCTENQLDPLEDSRFVDAARDRYLNPAEPAPVEIPWYLFDELLTPIRTVRLEQLSQIGKLLGYSTHIGNAGRELMSEADRKSVLEYLNRYYPDWRSDCIRLNQARLNQKSS